MEMGTAIGPSGWRTGPIDLLQELYNRTQPAQSQLGNLVNGQKKYFYEASEAVINTFDLPADKADTLRDFAETLASLLDKAYPQVEQKLNKLLKALESNSVKIELGPRAKKTLHVTPEGEEWNVRAHLRKKTWIFSMPIYRVSAEAEFPDILNLSDQDLRYLQAGWRASDELDYKGLAAMTTTKPWQVLAWVAIRYGKVSINLQSLNVNSTRPTLEWNIRSSWKQQWPGKDGKELAKQQMEKNVMAYLTYYLGDGEKHRDSLRFAIGDTDKYLPRELASKIVDLAYEITYGHLLDIIESDKWQTLKKLKELPQLRNPIYVTFQGRTFWLNYYKDKQILQARTLFKDLSEALTFTKTLAEMGFQAKVRQWQYQERGPYYFVELNRATILKLAEKSPEWRRALEQATQKRNKQL
jgi:hypothetical protein